MRMDNRVTTEEFHKEIDLIQSCISRMADNCFRLKEWYVSLIAVVLSVLISQKCDIVLISLFVFGITSVFWGLDAFYLRMETLYRWKYEWVIKKRGMGEKNFLYDLNPHNRNMWLDENEKKDGFCKFVFNNTLIPLYLSVIAVTIVVLICNMFI